MTHEAYCQPCVSPVWDTGLACHALLEVGGEARGGAGAQGAANGWRRKQVLDVRGDWVARRPRSCGPAAGRSNMPIRTIPTSTTPRWW